MDETYFTYFKRSKSACDSVSKTIVGLRESCKDVVNNSFTTVEEKPMTEPPTSILPELI
jgi:hypothetical protein